MDLYIPYAYSPYDKDIRFGVFSTRENAQQILDEQMKKKRWEIYDIYVAQLDLEDPF